ncbi:MAG: DNA (cytosine-5-)-methyltransferase [Cyanobacteria bacterium]|nr:DNA (cytosine-5-)-methyltransferase [Cyanobacteriota bacterium]
MHAHWQTGWNLSPEKREWFRQKSILSAARKQSCAHRKGTSAIRHPKLDISSLMPILANCNIDSVSLFSGCGGLDIGFERAGFSHRLSADILEICGITLNINRPSWKVRSGPDNGDVRKINWKAEVTRKNNLLVVHGGPPCQPFSNAGKQLGKNDPRNMVPEFFRAVNELKPDAFVMENVPALGSAKFSTYLDSLLHKEIGSEYHFKKFYLFAPHFGIPQQRNRLFIVGFKSLNAFMQFQVPVPTHSVERFLTVHRGLGRHIKSAKKLVNYTRLPVTMGVREALGLDDSLPDGLAPTFRSGFTGPRNSTSILNGASSQTVLEKMGIWGNGIAATRALAASFPTENGTIRLSVEDIALIQGFPIDWIIQGPVYKAIGQIGNSVAPPVAYQVAIAVKNALFGQHTHASTDQAITLASDSLLEDDQGVDVDPFQLSLLSTHR